MGFSLAIIILLGLALNKIFDAIKLPGLLGMLILGIMIGPYGLNIISADILDISADLRKIALIVILIRAGLGIKRDALKKVGIPAIKMSCIPGLCEGFMVMLLASYLFGISKIEAGMLGFIIAAVSPAVVVPLMLSFIDSGLGEKKGIPTLILAGASIDDVFAITIFSSFLGMYTGKNVNISMQIAGIPISIILGILMGLIMSMVMLVLFRRYHIRDTKKTLILLAAAIVLTTIEEYFKGIIPIASLLGVMMVGFYIREKSSKIADALSQKFNKIWVFAELMLFVLVGAQVNIDVAFNSGILGLVVIAIGLLARCMGVFISTLATELNWKERVFCMIAYVPKATVQAAIGAVPLEAGVASGELILAIAVLSIIITAPLGAIGIKVFGEKWLTHRAE
ncbi:cation:proton antiporter [Marinisporobacter balticus]|uniref:Sodium/proton antiporter (CPA1 family) n=1 Tax=Marinisporobacter balticus TaxID=2018667 RepID=A0A4R2LAX1_9FIRM|nr:cation:proton antiporter [Marinisporobacter balticus]TCO76425.1 sodium/proton antiporter (CPA1 family) [Marinisporobacter balticus]